MTVLSFDNQQVRVDWVDLKNRIGVGALCVMCFAAGGWVARINDHAADLPYKTAATAHYEQLQDVAGKNPAATVRCLRRENTAAKKVAKDAVSAANSNETVPVPSMGQITNCPPAPAVVQK